MIDTGVQSASARLSLPPLPAGLRRAAAAIRAYYPYTFAGSLLFGAGVALLVSGSMRENVYALLLGVLFPLILILLAALGRIQAVRFSHAQVRWDSSQTLIARKADLAERVTVDRVRSFLFFRLHVTVRGRLQVAGRAFLHVFREVSTVGGGEAQVPLELPLTGLLSTRGSTSIRDVFGLTRSRFGEDYHALRPVLPESVQQTERIPVAATGGNEEQNRKAQQDEEKYFMREYLPGDKARDINWKASSRFSQLITRISPYTQEKSQVIRIELRPYRRPREDSLDSVMHLNRMKSRVVSFMRVVKQEHPEYSFDLLCGEARWNVRTEEEIQAFARDLAGVFYRTDQGRTVPPPPGQLVIFTTPFDDRLQAALGGYGKSVLHIVTTTEPDAARKEKADQEPLFESVFSTPRIDLPVPGRWALRRERARSRLGRSVAAVGGATGTVTDEPIAVTLFQKT